MIQRRRQMAARAEPKLMAVEGKRVFVDGSALQELDTPPGAWARLCQARHLQQVAERTGASILVVSNPAEPGDRNKLVASMLGVMLCTPSCLACGKGTALQLLRALRVPRYIFVSAACEAKHRAMVNLMQSVSRGAEQSRWQFYYASARQKASFLARAARRAGVHASQLVTLVLPTERKAFARFPRVQTMRTFMQEIHKIDMGRSQMGYCRR